MNNLFKQTQELPQSKQGTMFATPGRPGCVGWDINYITLRGEAVARSCKHFHTMIELSMINDFHRKKIHI